MVKTLAGLGTGLNQRRVFKEGSLAELPGLFTDQFTPVLIHQVTLGDHDDAVREPQQAEDVKMFTGLLVDRIVGGDHQHCHVHAGGPGEHVPHEPFVAWYIHDAKLVRGQLQLGITKLDGDPAFLFFRQPVRVGTGQPPYQRGLAVVDMTGSTQNQVGDHGPASSPGEKRAGSTMSLASSMLLYNMIWISCH